MLALKVIVPILSEKKPPQGKAVGASINFRQLAEVFIPVADGFETGLVRLAGVSAPAGPLPNTVHDQSCPTVSKLIVGMPEVIIEVVVAETTIGLFEAALPAASFATTEKLYAVDMANPVTINDFCTPDVP